MTNLVGLILKGLSYLRERGFPRRLVIETLLEKTVEKPLILNYGKLYALEKKLE